MDELSISSEAYPELRGLDCDDLVLCRIKLKISSENLEVSKKRKHQPTDDDSCISVDHTTADVTDEVTSKRVKLATDPVELQDCNISKVYVDTGQVDHRVKQNQKNVEDWKHFAENLSLDDVPESFDPFHDEEDEENTLEQFSKCTNNAKDWEYMIGTDMEAFFQDHTSVANDKKDHLIADSGVLGVSNYLDMPDTLSFDFTVPATEFVNQAINFDHLE